MAGSGNTNFLSKTFEVVNDALNSFASNYSSVIAGEIAPIVSLGLILSFITIGIMAIRGVLDRPFMDAAWTMTKASIITTIALTTAVYQSYIIDPFLTLPDEMMGSISSSINGSNVIAGQGAAQAIENVLSLGFQKAGEYADEATFGLGLVEETDLMPYVYAFLILVGTILCVVVGALWLFISKIILALMIGVGPIFICCLVWNPLQQFFWSWVGQILNTILTAIFVLAIFSIFITLFETSLNNLVVSDTENNLLNAGAYTFLGILCMGVLLQIPQYVSALTGAAGGAVGTAMSRITRGAVSMGAGAAAGALTAGRSMYAGSQAVGAYKNARADKGVMGSLNAARHEFNRSMDDMKRGYPMHYQNGLNGNQRNSQNTAQTPTVPYHAGGAGVNFAKPTVGSKYGNK